MTVKPYIIFNGTCEEALHFYAKVFGGGIKSLMRYEGTPAETMSPDKNKVLHAEFESGALSFLASDGFEGNTASGMVHLTVNVEKGEDIDDLFAKMANGGKITAPLMDQFWGARFGMLTDRFGVNWMFNSEKEA